MKVEVAYDVPGELEADAAERAARAAYAEGEVEGADLTLIFVSDEALAELHGRFLDDPSPTDVMAFDLTEGAVLEHEVYVSVDCARRVARARGVSVERELALYVVHGVLHLAGHDDHDIEARARMRAAEGRVLRALGYPDDEAPHEFVGERDLK